VARVLGESWWADGLDIFFKYRKARKAENDMETDDGCPII